MCLLVTITPCNVRQRTNEIFMYNGREKNPLLSGTQSVKTCKTIVSVTDRNKTWLKRSY